MALELLPEWMAGLEEEDVAADPYIATIKRLAVNEKLDLDTAKVLIAEYKRTHGKKEEL